MSDVGKVVKMEDGRRYLVTEGSLHDGWFGGQRIVRRGKGLRAEVDGQEVWLDEMHRSLSASEVVTIKPYRAPRAPQPKKEHPIQVGPRLRHSMLAERALAAV